jgi:hypothetical protein
MTAAARVRAGADELRVAAEAMIVGLEAQADEYLDFLNGPAPVTPASRQPVYEALVRVLSRVAEADTLLGRIGGGLGDNLDLRPVIDLDADLRDTPADLRLKASVLEDDAAAYEVIAANTDLIIAELERREREARNLADIQAELQRFDQNQDFTPGARRVRPPPGAPPRAGGADGLAQYTLSEQIQLLRGVRDLALEYRDLAVSRARDLRVAAGDLTG